MEEIPTWLIGETTKIFFDFNSLLEYLSDTEALNLDKIETLKIRDKVLGGLL